MNQLTNNHLFGIFVCIAAYYGGVWLRSYFKQSWLNPLLFAAAAIIGALILMDIPFENFSKGGNVIHAFLGPVTVVLALPLYRQRHLLVRHKYAITIGVTTGCLTSILSVFVLSHFFNLTKMIERSIMPHSVTTPIGIGIAHSIGAIEGITVLSIVITGVFGAVAAPIILRLFKIKNPIAKGIATGTAAHAVGTTKALEMGETEGAMSGLAIGMAAIITVILITIIKISGLY